MRIELLHNKGYRWYSDNDIYTKGYLFDVRGNLFQNEDLPGYFAQAGTYEEIADLVINANGSFVVIVQKEKETIAAVDKIRSFPLFYANEGGAFISDDAGFIAETSKLKNQDVFPLEFLKFCGFTPDNATLYKSVSQLQAGQIISITDESERITPEFYYQHLHYRNTNKNNQQLYAQFSTILFNTFERLVKSVNGKTIVIPLSGGLDSRLIAAMLRKLNYPKVICYTYGRPDSYETNIAKQVAANLGFEWHFVEYSKLEYAKYFDSQSGDFRLFTGNYCALPQEQEYFAVRELVEKKIISHDSIFVPGYCGDLPAGSYFPSAFDLDSIKKGKKETVNFLIERHFGKHSEKPEFRLVKEYLTKTFDSFNWNSTDEFISLHENWFTRNKVSKYVVNGVRSFEYFGYEWRMPLWDNAFTDFFYQIPNELRTDKNFYRNYLSENIFQTLNIDFSINNFDHKLTHKSPLNSIKNKLPQGLKKILKPILLKKKDRDVNNTEILYNLVNETIFENKFKDKDKIINYILACWFVNEVEA